MTRAQSHETLRAGHGGAYRLAAGEAIEIVNPEGTQVVDTWAFSFAPGDERGFEFLAMDQTRSVNSTIFVRAGQTLVSDRRRPMLRFVEDTSPGVHDMLLCACNDAIYRELGCPPGHRSCSGNMHEALAALGLSAPFTPAPFNLFMNVPVAVDGSVDRLPQVCRPGDRAVFAAAMDLVLVLSACPQDVTPVNGAARRPTDILVGRI